MSARKAPGYLAGKDAEPRLRDAVNVQLGRLLRLRDLLAMHEGKERSLLLAQIEHALLEDKPEDNVTAWLGNVLDGRRTEVREALAALGLHQGDAP